MRIEVGYASRNTSRTALPARRAATSWCPYFKQGDYGGGLLAGAQAVAARLAEKRGVKIPGVAAPASGRKSRRRSVLPIWLIILVIFLIARHSRRRLRPVGRRPGADGRAASADLAADSAAASAGAAPRAADSAAGLGASAADRAAAVAAAPRGND